MILQVFAVPIENQLNSQVGYVIGHHYESNSSNVIMSMVEEDELLCCGLELGDLGVYHNDLVYDDSLPINVKKTGVRTKHRIAGVVAHVTSRK